MDERAPAGLTLRMAELICSTQFADLPSDVISYASKLSLSCIGAMIGGSRTPAGAIVGNYIRRHGAIERATVAGSGLRTSAELASLANGTFAHATEYEDNSFPEGVSTYTLVPPLLAVAEEHDLSGQVLILGLVVGQEIQSRLGRACRHALQRGFQQLPLIGTIAVAGAIARMLRFDRHKTAMAMSIAASQAAGIRIQNPFMAHFLESGTAARAGVMSAYLAADGLDGADYVLEGLNGHLGFCQMVSEPRTPRPADILDGWGAPYRILDVGMKMFPACFLLQPMIHELVRLRREAGFVPDDIDRIEVEGNATLAEACAIPEPRSQAAAYSSVNHVMAAAVLEPAMTIETFSDARIHDPAFKKLRARVYMTVHEDWPTGFLASPMRLHVQLRSGVRFDVETRGVRGLPPREHLTDEEVEEKFRVATSPVLGLAQVSTATRLIANLAEQPDVRAICRVLAGESS